MMTTYRMDHTLCEKATSLRINMSLTRIKLLKLKKWITVLCLYTLV